MSGFLPGNSRGFTLIELLVALALGALLLMVAVPAMRGIKPARERRTFVSQVNALTQFAWQNAIATGRTHELFFDLIKHQVVVRKEADKKDYEGKAVFKQVASSYVATSYQLPAAYEIKQFFINGKEELARHGAGAKDKLETWFYIVPNGLTQEVIINLLDTQDSTPEGEPTAFALVLNPFTAQFKVYDAFQKP